MSLLIRERLQVLTQKDHSDKKEKPLIDSILEEFKNHTIVESSSRISVKSNGKQDVSEETESEKSSRMS